MKLSKRPKVVSLFCGCGGLDIGFKELNFDLIYACDNNPHAIEVYTANVDRNAYVRDVTTKHFHEEIRDIKTCDVLLGGFPCQGFSKAGPKREEDARNFLYLEMRAAIEALSPKVFIAENVDGLSQNFKGAYLSKILNDFEKLDYKVEFRVLDAIHYGLPQHRRRIFFVGVKNSLTAPQFRWPKETHFALERNGDYKVDKVPDSGREASLIAPSRARSLKDAIYDLRSLNSNYPDHRLANNWSSNYSAIIKKIKPGQKLCNVRFSATSVYTWQIPEVFGEVDEIDIKILETIGRNRRHKKYGTVPNGTPLLLSVISELSEIRKSTLTTRLKSLEKKGYVKEVDGKFDLKGAMFCSGLFKRLRWDHPSPTVLTNFYNPRYFIHPQRDTPFTLRECARLQGFPDDFIFAEGGDVNKLVSGYKLVGNAVAPPLGKMFASATLNFLKSQSKK